MKSVEYASMVRYMYKFLFCFSFLLLVSCSVGKHLFGFKEQEDSKETYSQNDYKLYEVLKTDTIASVSRKFKVKTADVIIINQIPKPYYLEPGTIIKIPVYEPEGDNISREIDEIIVGDSKHNTSVTIAPPVKDKPAKEEGQGATDTASEQNASYETN